MKYLIETSSYSQLLRGHPEMAALIREAGEILVPSFTVAELRYGFAFGSKQIKNEKLLGKFLSSNKVRQVLPNSLTTDIYVELAIDARKQGRQLSHHDLWIAALALQQQSRLVSFDKDFEALSSLIDLQLISA